MNFLDKIEKEEVLAQDDLYVVMRDKYPVSPGHILIIVRRTVALFQELTKEEKLRLIEWIDWGINHLKSTQHPIPDGFNVGFNDGQAAGQTIEQLHVHIIPRYYGDVQDPRGGIRFVVPNKAKYWN